MSEPASFQCTLSAEQQNARRAEVRSRIIPYVRSVSRSNCNLSIEFQDSAGLRELIDEFVDLERQCCNFLRFSLSKTDSPLSLLIQGSQESLHIIELFHQALRGEVQ